MLCIPLAAIYSIYGYELSTVRPARFSVHGPDSPADFVHAGDMLWHTVMYA